jgi:hypothetical protein
MIKETGSISRGPISTALALLELRDMVIAVLTSRTTDMDTISHMSPLTFWRDFDVENSNLESRGTLLSLSYFIRIL